MAKYCKEKANEGWRQNRRRSDPAGGRATCQENEKIAVEYSTPESGLGRLGLSSPLAPFFVLI